MRAESLADEADRLAHSFYEFERAAWPVIEHTPFRDNWHLGAIADRLQAVTRGEIRRLQIWVPPGSMKSRAVNVLWPAWEWTTQPWLRYFSSSYDIHLSTKMAVLSRDLIRSPWYQTRWGDVVQLKSDVNLKSSYANTRGGSRLASSPGSTGSGEHGDRIIIDDPINALEIASEASLQQVIDWYDGTMSTRAADPKAYAEVIIMQRLHEEDLAAHALQFDEEWEVLCLPEVYEPSHPFAWPDDPREEGDLLWPDRVGEEEHRVREQRLGARRAAGQLQQRPAPAEGSLIKRGMWRYYPRETLDLAEDGDVTGFPRFLRLVASWDTTFKDKTSSDYVCGGLWGVVGGERYLLRVTHGRMSLSATKTAILDMRQWALNRWPDTAVTSLVEATANGPDIIAQLRREVTGIIPTKPSVSADQPAVKKEIRAQACEPDFEGGAVLIPGARAAELDSYDPALTPTWAQDLVEECATFPHGAHDDRVDMLTQALNWIRTRPTTRMTITFAEGDI